MKKWKALTVFGLVCALAAMPVLTFGAGSKEESSGGSGGGSSSSSGSVTAGGGPSASQKPTEVTVDANGVQTTGAGTVVNSEDGTIIAVPSNGTNAAGELVTSDANGNTVISNPATGSSVTVVVGKTADGKNSTAGLSQQTIDQFQAIDASKSMAGVLPQSEGYAVQANINLNVYDTATGAAVVGEQILTIKWTGLTQAMNTGNMMVGYYDNATGKYILVPIVAIDYATQTINIRVNGSGTARILTR
ncbi:MAG: hypothetical protein ACLUFH_12205 [Monoglobales bacterium]